MYEKILCPIDGSEHAGRALRVAITMAKTFGGELIICHALLRHADAGALKHFASIEGLAPHVEPEMQRLGTIDARLDVGPSYKDRLVPSRVLVEIGQHVLDDAELDAKEAGVQKVETVLMDEDAADGILRCIKERGADCVVMGSRGLSDLKGLFLGSVSHKVMNQAPCTCIAVK